MSQRFDAALEPMLFGLQTDTVPPGLQIAHKTYGTTGASYSPEIGNPDGYFYPTVYVNDTDQNVNVIAQGVALPMPQQAQRGGRMSAYDALASFGRAVTAFGSR